MTIKSGGSFAKKVGINSIMVRANFTPLLMQTAVFSALCHASCHLEGIFFGNVTAVTIVFYSKHAEDIFPQHLSLLYQKKWQFCVEGSFLCAVVKQ